MACGVGECVCDARLDKGDGAEDVRREARVDEEGGLGDGQGEVGGPVGLSDKHKKQRLLVECGGEEGGVIKRVCKTSLRVK